MVLQRQNIERDVQMLAIQEHWQMEYRDVLEKSKRRVDKARLHWGCDELAESLFLKNLLQFPHLTFLPDKHIETALVRRHWKV